MTGTPAPTGVAGEVVGSLGPNWFASVMGTGIVATAAATLPVHVPGLRAFAACVWVLAAVLLLVARRRGGRALGAAPRPSRAVTRATR